MSCASSNPQPERAGASTPAAAKAPPLSPTDVTDFLPAALRSPRWLRHNLALTGLIALLLTLPMLGSGLLLDDYEQRIKLLTGDTSNIFQTFARGDTLTEHWFETGLLPWWLHPEARINFLRPLATLFLQLDYRLWPDQFWLMHAHSSLWYVLLVLIAALNYRQFLALPWVAALAALLFAIDFQHAGAVIWLCNRNVMISMCCTLLALYCHSQEKRPLRPLAWLLFAAGLAGGESALAISGYLLAYELCLASTHWWRRLLSLLPYALIGLSYLAYWHGAGYGASGPGFYIDPLRDPLYFLSELAYRAPAYLVSQFLPPPVEVYALLGQADSPLPRWWPIMLLALLSGLLAWFFWPLLQSSATARFLCVGMLISLIPISGSSPVGRALWHVGFAASGLLALFVQHHQDSLTRQSLRRYSRSFMRLMLLHLWLSPLLFVASPLLFAAMDQHMDSRHVKLPSSAGNEKVLLLSSNHHWAQVSFPLLKDMALALGSQPQRAPPEIRQLHTLIEGQGAFELSRPEESLLVVRLLDPQRQARALINLRPPPYGFDAGTRITQGDMQVEVAAVTSQGSPTEIHYRFPDGALSGYRVMEVHHEQFIDSQLPAPGGRRALTVD